MSKFETISQSLFDSRSKEAILRTPLRKEVNLKDVEIIKNNVLRLGDKQIKMTPDAFKGICKIVGLPVGFDKTFSSAFGDKARQALVNRLKVAVQAKGATTLSLVFNPETREIIGIQKDPRDLISNQTFLIQPHRSLINTGWRLTTSQSDQMEAWLLMLHHQRTPGVFKG